MKKSEATRARVLRAAIELFNERGVAAVNTHQVAEAAGLSPGNLYYHFRNKQQIVREIFDQAPLFSAEWWQERASEAGENAFANFVELYFRHVREYRFLFRDQVALMAGDPALAERWSIADRDLRNIMRQAAMRWVEGGFMEPFESSDDIDAFIDNTWIILSFSAVYYESRGETSAPALEAAVRRQLRAFLRRYHTAKGRAVIASVIQPG